MSRAGTKSAKIMRLYEQGLSTREIAEKVDCKPEYVRVVARQRKGRGQSEIDKRYIAKAFKLITKDDLNQVARNEYRKCRANGDTPREAALEMWRARSKARGNACKMATQAERSANA